MLVLNYIPMFFCVNHKFDVDSFSDVFHGLTEHTVIHELDKVFFKMILATVLFCVLKSMYCLNCNTL